jgi:hypothetical protein
VQLADDASEVELGTGRGWVPRTLVGPLDSLRKIFEHPILCLMHAMSYVVVVLPVCPHTAVLARRGCHPYREGFEARATATVTALPKP